MSFTTDCNGRLCNQIIRNAVVSIIAQKHDLFVNYSSYDKIKSLGIDLYIGKTVHNITKRLTDDNFFEILSAENIDFNVDPNSNYFQKKEIIHFLYCHYFQKNINQIIANNPFGHRISNNNDCFIHVRLGDVAHYNPGIEYYLKALSAVKFNQLYIASDDINHAVVNEIVNNYKNAKLLNLNEVETIQFGSTNKTIILSHGSFSAMIGYLSEAHSRVYYPCYNNVTIWFGDMFSFQHWNMVNYK